MGVYIDLIPYSPRLINFFPLLYEKDPYAFPDTPAAGFCYQTGMAPVYRQCRLWRCRRPAQYHSGMAIQLLADPAGGLYEDTQPLCRLASAALLPDGPGELYMS